MEELIDILIRCTAYLLILALIWLVRTAIAYLKARLKEKDAAILDKFIDELTAAAEQMFRKEDDEGGSARLGYVEGMLIEAGYDLTDAIRAKIESSVYKINTTPAGE